MHGMQHIVSHEMGLVTCGFSEDTVLPGLAYAHNMLLSDQLKSVVSLTTSLDHFYCISCVCVCVTNSQGDESGRKVEGAERPTGEATVKTVISLQVHCPLLVQHIIGGVDSSVCVCCLYLSVVL